MAFKDDFKCAQCGAEATRLGTLEGVLGCCDEHIPGPPHRTVELRGIDRDLWNHRLEVVAEHPEVSLYRLVDPRCGGEMQSMRLVFAAHYVAIYGDWCPGRETQDNRGVFSDYGYDLTWFVGATSEDYLCQKFLGEVFVPERAVDVCKERLGEVTEGTKSAELQELLDEAESLDVRDVESIEAWKRRLYEVTEDSEVLDGCYGYELANAALLCAIQRRFRYLWLARVRAATQAAP